MGDIALADTTYSVIDDDRSRAITAWLEETLAAVGQRLSGVHHYTNSDLDVELYAKFTASRQFPRELNVELTVWNGGVDVTTCDALLAVLPVGATIRGEELEEVGRSCIIDLPAA